MARETTLDDPQDDLPVGTEAMCLPKSHYNEVTNGDELGTAAELPATKKPSDKRLQWVSALDKTQGSSLNSSRTSNSRKNYHMRKCVDELLQQREMDPETLLNNIGFGCNPNTDQSYTRIPDRFLAQPSNTGGVDLYDFVLTHPEIHHLLPIWENQPARNRTGMETSAPATAASAQSNGKDAWGRARTFSSVVHGMRFIQGVQAETHKPPQETASDLTELPSILDLPNRKFLAQQGFYGKDFVPTATRNISSSESKPGDAKSPSSKSLNAMQRRKQFHHASRSARSNNWSLTDDSDDNVVSSSFDTANTSSGSESSFDQGLFLRSFSTGICSESSEDNDSFEKERQLYRQKSIKALRQQYQETIRQSLDGEIPVFDNLNNIDVENSFDYEHDQTLSIKEIRKVQVSRLMSSIDDDGDYLTISRPLTQKSMLSPLQRAQNSTQSTLTGSPNTPKDFLFDKSITDGEHFQFPDTTSPKRANIKPVVSITVDESEAKEDTASEAREFTHTNSLEPLLMHNRSDSCHTLVSQDSSNEHDVSGNVTPRPNPGQISPGLVLLDQPPSFIDNKYISGDALSESTSSSGTLNTVVVMEDLTDLFEPRSRSPLQRSGSAIDLESEHLCLSKVYPPQESFELEEISSADNTFDEFSTYSRNHGKRGPIEKSASTHSDSSGFVDLDTPGEPQQFMTSGEPQNFASHGEPQQFASFGEPQHFVIDAQQDDFMFENKKFPLSKSRTFDTKYDVTHNTMATRHLHDNQLSQSLLQLPVASSSKQTETVQRSFSENINTTDTECNHEREIKLDTLKHVHVCKKQESIEDREAENQNPTLTSISVVGNVNGKSDKNKSILYTIHVPSLDDASGVDGVQSDRLETKKQYITTMKINVPVKDKNQGYRPSHNTSFTVAERASHERTSQDNNNNSPVSRSEAVELASDAVKHKFSGPGSLIANHDEKQIVHASADKHLLLGNPVDLTCEQSDHDIRSENIYPSNNNVDNCTVDTNSKGKPGNIQDSYSTKKHVLHKRHSKESLIATHNQTADWLLSNQRAESQQSKQFNGLSCYHNLDNGKQMSASTPNLRNRETQTFDGQLRKDILTFYFPSTNRVTPTPTERTKELNDDTSLTEIKQSADKIQDLCQNTSFSPESSFMNSLKSHDLLEISGNVVPELKSQASSVVMLESLRPDSSLPSTSTPQKNKLSESAGDNLGYYKLARLTNAPAVAMHAAGQQQFPLMRYQPYRPLTQVRKWHDLNKLKHLEEETSLMQHALQRYKVELTIMETMLLTTIAMAGTDLDHEDRAELEDLQSLWSEVKKEVSNMEVHLSNRLTCLKAGNDQFSPFNAMSIVQSMIDLLREQLYQQQMCLYKDVNGNDDDVVTNNVATPAESVWSDISREVRAVKDCVAQSQAQQKAEMEQSFADLKDTIVQEVKCELQSNTKWLQLQLQSKDNEIQRLKMELFLQRVNTGETRKRETFESDV